MAKKNIQERLAAKFNPAAANASAAPAAARGAPAAPKAGPKALPPPLPAPAPLAAAPAPAPAPVAAAPVPVAVAAPEDRRVIVVLSKANPRRAGTLAARTFELYRTGQTVAEWRAAVAAAKADKGYLSPDAKRGFIAILPAGSDVNRWLAERATAPAVAAAR
jgi:hypothetical protein